MKPIIILGAAVIGGILYLFSEDEKPKTEIKKLSPDNEKEKKELPLTKAAGANPATQKEELPEIPIQDTDEEIRDLRKKLRHATNSRKKSRELKNVQ